MAAHEHDASSADQDVANEVGHRVGYQLQVTAPAVAFGARAFYDSGLLQHVEVMSQQVARHPKRGAQLARRGVAQDQSVNDSQPPGLTQRRVHPGSADHISAVGRGRAGRVNVHWYKYC